MLLFPGVRSAGPVPQGERALFGQSIQVTVAAATLWRSNVTSIWPSVAMLGVCLAAAALFQPYWIGALGALVATAAERRRPMMLIIWDDNLNVVAMSLAVMGALARVPGI